MMTHRPRTRPTRRQARAGFTLVELLVAVGLTVLMMTLFTSIFSLASGSVTTQRGISRNDQKARTMVTVLRNDIQNRTFRIVRPYNSPNSITPDQADEIERRGYFYVSENQDGNQTDDVFALTIVVDDDDPLYGRARALGIPESAEAWKADTPYTSGAWVRPSGDAVDLPNGMLFVATNNGTSNDATNEPTWPTSPSSPPPSVNDNGIVWRGFQKSPAGTNRNQPDWDDSVGGNESTQSKYAEVAIFLRGDKLVRRVQLIRNVFDATDAQPQNTAGDLYFDPATRPAYYGNFWGDFDASVYRFGAQNRTEFHSISSLRNDATGSTDHTGPQLGRPRFRFGFDVLSNQPKEYLQGDSGKNFIGRYLHEETSYAGFLYPQFGESQDSAGTDIGNPMAKVSSPEADTWELNNRGVVKVLSGGSRRGEDILMSNVLRFDVKLWDPLAQEFVDVGNGRAGSASTFAQANNQHVNPPTMGDPQLTYGPRNTANLAENRIFDTWHPMVRAEGATNGEPDPPPFILGSAERLRAIQLTIQYTDPGTGQVREVVIQESLLTN